MMTVRRVSLASKEKAMKQSLDVRVLEMKALTTVLRPLQVMYPVQSPVIVLVACQVWHQVLSQVPSPVTTPVIYLALILVTVLVICQVHPPASFQGNCQYQQQVQLVVIILYLLETLQKKRTIGMATLHWISVRVTVTWTVNVPLGLFALLEMGMQFQVAKETQLLWATGAIVLRGQVKIIWLLFMIMLKLLIREFTP